MIELDSGVVEETFTPDANKVRKSAMQMYALHRS
jgi:hypothetical protein